MKALLDTDACHIINGEMYARVKRATNSQGKTYEYLQIVEAVREQGKVRQKVLLTVGRLDEIDQARVDRLIESLGRFGRSLLVLRPTEDMETESSRTLGTPLVLRRVFQDLRLPRLLESLRHSSRFGPYVPDAVFALVLNRLMDPMSKLSLYEWLPTVEDAGVRGLELQYLYRALDFLAKHKEQLEDRLFFASQQLELFAPEVDLAFFDTGDHRGRRSAPRVLEGQPARPAAGGHRSTGDPPGSAGGALGVSRQHRGCHGLSTGRDGECGTVSAQPGDLRG